MSSPSRTGRLVLFCPGYRDAGGAARRARMLAGGLARRGWDVRVVSRIVASRRFSLRRLDGVTVLEVPELWRGGVGTALFLALAIPVGMAWGARSVAFVAIQLVSPTTAAAVCSMVLRRPYLALATTSGEFSETQYVMGSRLASLRRRLLSRASYLVAQTEMVAEELTQFVPSGRVAVMPNPVELVDAPPLTGAPRVLYTGRLSEEKNLLRLLDAWRTVAAQRPDALLTLAGEGGPYRSVEPQLRELVSGDAVLRRSVRFTGWVLDVRPLLADADVYVLPSLTEGMSNALLEACAWGRVVVASDIPGNRAVLGDDHPLLFAPEDTTSLLRALELALGDEQVRRRAVVSVTANVRRFSVDAVVIALEELIGEATDRPRH